MGGAEGAGSVILVLYRVFETVGAKQSSLNGFCCLFLLDKSGLWRFFAGQILRLMNIMTVLTKMVMVVMMVVVFFMIIYWSVRSKALCSIICNTTVSNVFLKFVINNF